MERANLAQVHPQITEALMAELGAQHRRAGGELTPHACREVDARLFAAMKGESRPAAWYSKMRGAFNAAWQREHFALVMAGNT